MLSWIIRRKIDAFEREFSYDMDYLRELLGISVKATLLFHKATGLGEYREGLPKEAWHAARIWTARTEDCGPCTQLVTTMAERDGVSGDVIRAVLRDAVEDAPEGVRLSVQFVRAVSRRDPEADALRQQVVARFGSKGLVSLAFAMLSARLYPTLKYALGYGHTCSVIQVAGSPVATVPEAD
jgi:alkylhydroperoxidase family enzyme